MPALVVTAVRLGAVEALAPTAAIVAGSGFPTLAGGNVYDSRMLPLDALSETVGTPIIAVYTETVRGDPRGPLQGSRDANLSVDLVLEIDLAIRIKVGDEDVIIPADSDWKGELVLDFLAAQARRVIIDAIERGVLLRVVKQITDIEAFPMRLPDIGARLLRRTLRLRCAVDDDRWSAAGGLPEPLATLRGRLPDSSLAAVQLDKIAAAIVAPDPLPILAGVTIITDDPLIDAALVVDGAADGVVDQPLDGGTLAGTGHPGATVEVEIE